MVPGVFLAVILTACSGPPAQPSERILVSAAASLTDAFAEIEREFEKAHPDVDVILNVAGSSTLREQILGGAPADVFASANISNMEQVVDAGEAAEPEIFARNRLEIVVPTGNPAGVTGLEDFADESLLIGLCAEQVPCGEFARQALAKAGVTPVVDTNEPDVRALLTKVEVGELDAAITYVTDVESADGVADGVIIPDELNVIAQYPIAVLTNAANPNGARAFVTFMLSEGGSEIMTAHGFATP